MGENSHSIGVMLNVRERLSWDGALSPVLGHEMTDVARGILPRCCKEQTGPGWKLCLAFPVLHASLMHSWTQQIFWKIWNWTGFVKDLEIVVLTLSCKKKVRVIIFIVALCLAVFSWK